MTLLTPQAPGIPVPRPTELTKTFWDGCAGGKLLYQRCASCGIAVFNPGSLCPACRSRDLAWRESEGRGSIYSWTVAHRPLSPAFTPVYAPIIVDLDEGYQMVSNLVDCDDGEIAVGLRVEVVFHQVGDITLPYFRPTAA